MEKRHDYHHGDLRNALLDAAEQELRADPRRAVSIRALAGKIGVSATAPHAHFRTRADLLAALATRGFQRLRDEMVRKSAGAADIETKLAALAEVYLDFSGANPGLYRIMFLTGVDLEACPDLRMASLECYGVLEATIRDAAVGLSANEAQDLTFAAWGLVHGFASLLSEGWLIPEVVRSGSTKDLAGLAARTVARSMLSR